MLATIALILARSLLKLNFDVYFRIMKIRKMVEPSASRTVTGGRIYQWILLISLVLAGGQISVRAQSLNVTDFGAAGDAVQFYVSTTAGSPVVTTTNQLSSADIGKTIEVFGVGQQTIGINSYGVNSTNNLDLIATITNVDSTGTNISISLVPQATLNNTFATYGTDNTPAIRKAIAAAGSNATINFPNGTFLCMPTVQTPGVAYSIASIVLNRGGLHFLGSGATTLLSRGAFRPEDFTAWGWGNSPARGYLFEIAAPITNDYPIVVENLTLDGGVQNGNLNVHGISVNVVDGLGWDVSHTAWLCCDNGNNTGTATHQIFTNVVVQHWRGEMFKSIDGNNNGNISIYHCIFRDGCATALNIYGSWDVTGNRFENLLDLFEYYQAYYTNTSYFRNNFVTNMTGNGTSFNGGTWTAPPFIVQSNVFYFGTANGIGFTPAANVSILNNQIYFPSNSGTVFAIGTAGSQGINNQFNTNIVIAGNNIIIGGQAAALLGYGGPGILAVAGLTFCSNTVSGVWFNQMIAAGSYCTNVAIFNNDFGTKPARFSIDPAGGGIFPLIQTNNLYVPWSIYWDTVQTNVISYSSGPKQYMDYVAGGNVFILNDTQSNQIPPGAELDIDNRSNRWTMFYGQTNGNIVVYPSQVANIAPVTVPLGFLQTFYWTGSAWSDNAISSQTSSSTNTVSPPTNLHIMN